MAENTDAYPKQVNIFEVGPRDGLQNETTILSVEDKVNFIQELVNAGLKNIEVASFVSSKWVPQMANSLDVCHALPNTKKVKFSGLTPNLRGLESAIAAGVDEIAVFGAASELFSQKNINCSVAESINRFAPVVELAQQHDIPVRGYVSTVLGCPYQGNVPLQDVINVVQVLHDMGCYQISLGDTIGVGTPLATQKLLEKTLETLPKENIAVHFHNTYGQALANILIGLQLGITTIDTATAGLGGCPYAKGASGNIATEDVVYMCHGMGIETGIDLEKLITAGRNISRKLQRQPQSLVNLAQQ